MKSHWAVSKCQIYHFPRPVKQWHHSHLEWRTPTTFAITLTSFQRERVDTKKVMSKVTFPRWFVLLRGKKKKSWGKKKKKKRRLVLLSPAIDSASVKKHNRVKSVLKSGEDPSGSVPFSPPQPKGDPLSPLCPQHPQWGLPTIHAAKWSRERYVTMKLQTWNVPQEYNERVFVCVSLGGMTNLHFLSAYNKNKKSRMYVY